MSVTEYQHDTSYATKPRVNTMKSTYGEDKYDRSNEMNSAMTIAPSAPDEFENRVATGK